MATKLSNATWAKKLSTTRLEALLQVASRGIDELEMDDEWEYEGVNIDAAREGYGVLLNELNNRNSRNQNICQKCHQTNNEGK
jgi:hypothetical protein